MCVCFRSKGDDSGPDEPANAEYAYLSDYIRRVLQAPVLHRKKSLEKAKTSRAKKEHSYENISIPLPPPRKRKESGDANSSSVYTIEGHQGIKARNTESTDCQNCKSMPRNMSCVEGKLCLPDLVRTGDVVDIPAAVEAAAAVSHNVPEQTFTVHSL